LKNPALALARPLERKENKMNTIKLQTKRPPHMGAVLLPWEALYEFGRMICLGFAATFGGTPSAGKTRPLQPNLNEDAGMHSIQSGNTWSSLQTASVFAEHLPQERS